MPDVETRTEIEVREELSAVTDETVDALAALDGNGLFIRGGILTRLARQDRLTGDDRETRGLRRIPGTLFVSVAPMAYIRERIDVAAAWWKPKFNRAKKKYIKAPALPPAWVAETIAARGEWPFPVLQGVATTPLMRADGSILDAPGYDAASGIYYAPSMGYDAIPSSPTARDAGRAAAELAEVFQDFPFDDGQSDLAVALALPLSILARPAIKGSVPMFAFRAPTPGTGKGLCADVGFLIALGHDAARTSPPLNDEKEMKKLLLSIAIAGDSAVLFDNVDCAFGSAALDMALTSMEIMDRVLSLSKTATVPLRAVFAITGNNLTFKGALGRRVVVCDLDSGVENPEDRTGFAHPELRAWVTNQRSRLVASCLTLLRAYDVAGRPAHSHPPKGSFEAWDALIRGALIWVGVGDPLGGQSRVREEGDSDRDALRAGLVAWEEMFGSERATAADAIDRSKAKSEVRAGLALFAGCDESKIDARRLGYALRRCKGRPCDGRRFIRDGEDKLVGIKWSVQANRVGS